MPRSFWLACYPLGLALSGLVPGCGSGPATAARGTTAQPDFTITPPASVTVAANATQTITIGVTGKNGFSAPVQFSLTGLPPGITATPSSFTLTPGASSQSLGITHDTISNSSQLIVLTTDKSVAPGSIPVTITATSGSISHSETTSTTQPDFALSGPTALTAGSTAAVSAMAEVPS